MNLDRIIAVRNNKTVYRDGDRCLKVFNEGYSKADVLNEALNQARIEETGLNIPRVLEVTVIDGKWTIVSDYIKGKTLAQLMQENPEKKDEYLNLFVDLQLEMHSKTCPLLNKLKDKMNRKICQTDLSATVRYDLHTRLESMPKHNKVCHGDFNPSNVIITDDGTPYIMVARHPGQRLSRRRAHISPLLAQRRYRRREEVSESFLREERHRDTVCPEMDAHRCRITDGQGQRCGARIPPLVDRCC